MSGLLVLQSDFGLSDGAVSAMYGVALSVDRSLSIFDLTHDIPPFQIWDASYRLLQTMPYWPDETVFVSVVDPGVGSDRKSVVVKTSTNHYVVTPDNGTLTHLYRHVGIVEARIIDEEINRLPHSGASHTFHGRDIYAYTGARLASRNISFQEVGPPISLDTIIQLPIREAHYEEQHVTGFIEILDVRYGNLWTNISRDLFQKLQPEYGLPLEITILNGAKEVYHSTMIFGRSFADAEIGAPILYINSIDHLAIAINQDSFAKRYQIGTGAEWAIKVERATSLSPDSPSK
jgi:S-adenosylmethionine hydrolase